MAKCRECGKKKTLSVCEDCYNRKETRGIGIFKLLRVFILIVMLCLVIITVEHVRETPKNCTWVNRTSHYEYDEQFVDEFVPKSRIEIIERNYNIEYGKEIPDATKNLLSDCKITVTQKVIGINEETENLRGATFVVEYDIYIRDTTEHLATISSEYYSLSNLKVGETIKASGKCNKCCNMMTSDIEVRNSTPIYNPPKVLEKTIEKEFVLQKVLKRTQIPVYELKEVCKPVYPW